MRPLKSKRVIKRARRIQANTNAALLASVFASGSGSAMIGAFFGPVGAILGGVAGAATAYVVEQNNLNH